MTAVAEQTQSTRPGDWYYVTDRSGEIVAVYVIAAPFERSTYDHTEFAWTGPHQRPPGEGWGDKPAAEQLDHRDHLIALMWVRQM